MVLLCISNYLQYENIPVVNVLYILKYQAVSKTPGPGAFITKHTRNVLLTDIAVI